MDRPLNQVQGDGKNKNLKKTLLVTARRAENFEVWVYSLGNYPLKVLKPLSEDSSRTLLTASNSVVNS